MSMVKRTVWTLTGALCWTLAGAAEPADPRFFGTYCGSAEVEHCVRVKVKFLGITVSERTECRTVDLDDIRLQLEHRDTPRGGVVGGSGRARANGDPVGFVVAAAVMRRGLARGSATVAGLEPYASRASLSEDGRALTVLAYGKVVTVRKDACGNAAPQVSIASPADGATLEFGRMQTFRAEITDAEDADFPRERQAFVSDRDGVLTGTVGAFAHGLTLFTNQLSPGEHTITFSATDSGGLTDSASIAITVGNEPPETPVILQPHPTDTLVATGEVQLEGKAYDREDGMLADGALSWTSQKLGSPLVLGLGTGRRLSTAFPTPGSYVLRLTATDRVGSQSVAQRTVAVQPFDGNTPPRVAITVPDHLSARGEIAAALVAGAVDFVGTASDAEDPVPDLQLTWQAEPVDPPGPAMTFGTDTTVATATLSAVGGQSTFYRVTLSATDSGGLTASTRIKVLVLPSPIL